MFDLNWIFPFIHRFFTRFFTLYNASQARTSKGRSELISDVTRSELKGRKFRFGSACMQFKKTMWFISEPEKTFRSAFHRVIVCGWWWDWTAKHFKRETKNYFLSTLFGQTFLFSQVFLQSHFETPAETNNISIRWVWSASNKLILFLESFKEPSKMFIGSLRGCL